MKKKIISFILIGVASVLISSVSSAAMGQNYGFPQSSPGVLNDNPQQGSSVTYLSFTFGWYWDQWKTWLGSGNINEKLNESLSGYSQYINSHIETFKTWAKKNCSANMVLYDSLTGSYSVMLNDLLSKFTALVTTVKSIVERNPDTGFWSSIEAAFEVFYGEATTAVKKITQLVHDNCGTWDATGVEWNVHIQSTGQIQESQPQSTTRQEPTVQTTGQITLPLQTPAQQQPATAPQSSTIIVASQQEVAQIVTVQTQSTAQQTAVGVTTCPAMVVQQQSVLLGVKK